MGCEARYWIKLTVVAGGTAHATQSMEAPTVFVKENTKYTFGMTYMSHADYTDGDTTLKLQLLDSSNDILKEIIVPTKNLDKKIHRIHDYLMYISDGVSDVCLLTNLDKIKIVADDTRAAGANRYLYITDIFIFEGDFFARTPYGYGYGNYDSFWAIERIQLATKERIPATPYRPGLYTEENVDLLLANKNATVTAYIRNMDAGDVVNVDIDGDIIVGRDIKGSGSLELSSGGFPIFYVDNANFYYAEALATPYYYISIDVANKIILIGDDVAISNDSALEVVKADEVTKLRFATFSDTLGDCPRLYFHKSHNDTLQTKTETIDNDELGRIIFYGCDGGDTFATGAQIQAIQNGAAGAAWVPTDLILLTSSNAVENANQLVLYHDGKVGIGVAIPSEKLDVGGDIQCTSGKFSDAFGIIWTEAQINTAAAGDAAAMNVYEANAVGRNKVRTYFVKRPWMNMIRATVEIQSTGMFDMVEFRCIVNGNNGSLQTAAGPGWVKKESIWDCSALTNGTLYEIILWLRGTIGANGQMRYPVIQWSI